MRRPSKPGLLSTVISRPGRVATDRAYISGAGSFGGASGGVDPSALHDGDSAGGDLTGSYPDPDVQSIGGLRVVRGIVDTSTGGSVLEGVGFTVARNGVGDLSVDFADDFADVPAVVLTAAPTVAEDISLAELYDPASATASGFRLFRFDNTGAAADGVVHFVAVGPL
jgi:hypothetical protein